MEIYDVHNLIKRIAKVFDSHQILVYSNTEELDSLKKSGGFIKDAVIGVIPKDGVSGEYSVRVWVREDDEYMLGTYCTIDENDNIVGMFFEWNTKTRNIYSVKFLEGGYFAPMKNSQYSVLSYTGKAVCIEVLVMIPQHLRLQDGGKSQRDIKGFFLSYKNGILEVDSVSNRNTTISNKAHFMSYVVRDKAFLKWCLKQGLC